MTGTVSIGVDPGAPRPEVGFRVHTPDSWLTLDLDPASSDAWVERVLDERIAEHPEAARHRGHLRRVLQALIEQQRAAGVFVCAILTAGSRPAELIGANLALSWVRLASVPEDVTWLARYFADEEPADGEFPQMRAVELVDLPAGPAVRVRTSLLAPVPETSRRQRVAITQFVVPVPGSSWLGVLVVSTPNLALADVFARLADDAAQSLRFLDPETAGPAAPTPPPARKPLGTIGYLPPPT
ncbi:MAG: hypothetical protein V7637_2588 [Mycobacteriales bacterium]